MRADAGPAAPTLAELSQESAWNRLWFGEGSLARLAVFRVVMMFGAIYQMIPVLAAILTGVILQVSRAAGETAPIMFTGAAFYLPFLPQSVQDQCMALSMHLFTVSTQVPNVPEALPYATALVLLGLVVTFNFLSIGVRTYLRSRRKW